MNKEQHKMPKYLSVDIVAERLDLSRETIYRLVRGGKLKGYRFGRSVKIYEKDLLDFIKQSTLEVCQ